MNIKSRKDRREGTVGDAGILEGPGSISQDEMFPLRRDHRSKEKILDPVQTQKPEVTGYKAPEEASLPGAGSSVLLSVARLCTSLGKQFGNYQSDLQSLPRNDISWSHASCHHDGNPPGT